MIRNYLTTAFRILMRQKSYSAINIFGLTLGITSTLLLMLYITDELSYDKFHPDAERTYRATFKAKLQDTEISTIFTGVPMAETLLKDVPAVESTLRIAKWNTIPVRYEDKTFTERNFLLSDSNFFEFYAYKLLVGNPKTVLDGPNKIVITESTARKYFGYTGPGDLSPIGKTFAIGSQGETKAEVTGIAADVPHNTHLKFDFLLSLPTSQILDYPVWLNSAVVTYFKIHPKGKIESVNDKYSYFIETYVAKEIQQFLKMDLQKFTNSGSMVGFESQRLLDIHLRSQFSDELEPNGNLEYLYLIGTIAGMIILLACINFMNLSTARAANRAKEVGIRKTIGALRNRLIGQFMVESYMYTIVAVVLGLVLVSLALDPFNIITTKSITFTSIFNPTFIIGLVLFTLAIGLIAGSYPAFYLTAFKPAEVLKGKVRAGMKSSGVRNGLVVFQFFISISLIIATLIVFQQLKYVQKQNLGFNKDNILCMMHTMNLTKNSAAFKNELLQYPEISAATYSNRMPPYIDWNSTFRIVESGEEHLLTIYTVDYDLIKTMGYEVVAGRFFSRDFPADSSRILINETAMRQFGWDSFEGKKIMSRFNTMEEREVEVIGVLKDFNFETLKSTIRPMIIFLGGEPNFEMGVRFASGDVQKNLAIVESVWKKYAPDAPFEYSFLDANFDATFRSEQRMGQLFIIFTGLAILIACLGLLGLAAFSAEQRTKEIGIRKVMGATVPNLIFLMTKDFSRLVMVSFIIAAPVAWWALDKFLQRYPYHIDFPWWVLMLAGSLALLFAVIIVSTQALRAATANPSQSLRSE
jgi:putative ABC transport system permease protein